MEKVDNCRSNVRVSRATLENSCEEHMPTVEQIRPGKPEPLGPTLSPTGSISPFTRRGRRRIELLLFRQHRRSQAGEDHSAVSRDEQDGRHLAYLRRRVAERTLYNYRADGPYNPAAERDAVQRPQRR